MAQIRKSVLMAVVTLTAAGTHLMPCLAGTAVKWEEVPKPVQETVLTNGGSAGPVDKETEVIDGKAVYEASVKGKDGVVRDLVITADGKLVKAKSDDADDKTAERNARAAKLLKGVKFSHPREINHPYLPLSQLKQDVFEGTEGGKKVRVERTAKPDVRKTIKVGDMMVDAFVVEDRAFLDGELEEVATDYFAQDDNGTVYYLGEEVDEYKDGKIANHEGSWMTGKDTPVPGVLLPAVTKVGTAWTSEDVSDVIGEKDEVASISETVTVPAGTFKDCIKVTEHLADGTTEYKFYAKGVGVVREVPQNGDEQLKSHSTADKK